jgi:hypothetical protein
MATLRRHGIRKLAALLCLYLIAALPACEGTHARQLVEAKCAKAKGEWGTCEAGAAAAETYVSYKLYAKANISRETPEKALAQFEEAFIKGGLPKRVAIEWAQKAVSFFKKPTVRNVALIGIVVGASSVAISLLSADHLPSRGQPRLIEDPTLAAGTAQQPLLLVDQGTLTGKKASDTLAAAAQGRPFFPSDAPPSGPSAQDRSK